MANGLRPYILNDLKSVAQGAYAGSKIDMKGFLSMLVSGNGASPIKLDSTNGHKNEARFWYAQRATKSMTDTSKSCDNVLTPARKEVTVSAGNTRQIAYHLTDELVATYTDEASRNGSFGQLSGISQEMVDILFRGANAILEGVNDDLLGLVTWGRNRVSGSNAAVTLNISKDSGVQSLSGGFPKLMSDYKRNNLNGRPNVVGAGLFYAWILSQGFRGLDQSGVDTRIAAGMVDFWADQDFADSVGADHIGVFEPGSIQLVEYNEYTGFKAGQKPGGSEFMNIAMPVADSAGNLLPVNFDVQLKYIDCPTTLTDAYSGGTATYDKGYSLIISKQFGLFQTPSDAFRNDDGSIAVNGALRYSVTNNCDTCS